MADDQTESPVPPFLRVPAAGDPGSAAGTVCPYCLAAFDETEAETRCPECSTLYHTGCWNENGGCGVYGCAHAATVEPRQAIEVPSSYWGEENKPCPSCGQQILAAAVRCRHCGATFATARPQQTDEYRNQREVQDRLPAARSRVVLFFVLSAIPFLAPVGLVAGLIWRASHRQELDALPALHAALHKIGLIASAVITIGLCVMTLMYVAVRG